MAVDLKYALKLRTTSHTFGKNIIFGMNLRTNSSRTALRVSFLHVLSAFHWCQRMLHMLS